MSQRVMDRPVHGVELTWADKRDPNTDDHRAPSGTNLKQRESGLRVQARYGSKTAERTNLLIVGDAARALVEVASGHGLGHGTDSLVRLCYLDPPFNTGERFSHYGDDIGRSTWLSMMHECLLAIRDLMAPDGSVWFHLDDAAQHHGRNLLDEVFGTHAFVATVIWQRRTSRDNRKAFSPMHDYIHVYCPSGATAWKKKRNALPDEGTYGNRDADPRGPWRSVPMSAQAGHGTPRQFYTITSPAGALLDPPRGRCWTYSEERFKQLVSDGRVYWPREGLGRPRLKKYASEGSGLAPFTLWSAEEVGDTASAKKQLLSDFPQIEPFDTPKPERLMERILGIGTNPNDLVLDPFLGSGTTAVVAERMRRRWIGIERESHTVEAFAMPRIKNELTSSGDAASGVTLVELDSAE